MLSNEYNAVLTKIVGIMFFVVSLLCESAGARQIERFSDIGESVYYANKVDIYYVALQDQGQGRLNIAELKERSAARITIQCGARCHDGIPRIVEPIMGARKIHRCPTYEIEFLIDFGASTTIAVTRDRMSFWYKDTCFQFPSDSTGEMLYGIFKGIWE